MAHDVFITYAIADKLTADAVVATLEEHRTRCWIAPRDVLAGVPWAQAVIEAINQSRVMVLVLSSRSNDSRQVMQEVERGASKGIPIIPFRIEDVALSPSLELFIASQHWLDALTPPLEEHLQHLAQTVGMLLSREREREQLVTSPGAPPPAARAAEAAADRAAEKPSLPPAGYETLGDRMRRRPTWLIVGGFGVALAMGIVAVVLAILLSGGGNGDSDSAASALSPTASAPTAIPTKPTEPTATPTIATPAATNGSGSLISLEDSPSYFALDTVLTGFDQLDPRLEGFSNEQLGLGPDFSEVVMYLSAEPFQLTFMYMVVVSGEIEKAAFRAEMRDEEALETAALAGFYEGAGTEDVATTIQWSDPAVGDAAKLASLTANFEGSELQFEMLIFYQEEGQEAAGVFSGNLWLPGEPPTVDTVTIGREVSANIANR